MGILPRQNELFEIPSGVCFLNCAYMSPSLRSVTRAGVEAVESKSSPWTYETKEFFEPAQRCRELFGQLAGVDPGGVSIGPSTAYFVSLAARNLRVDAGSNIVLMEDQFPSNVYPWHEKAQETGCEIRTAKPSQDETLTQAILRQIDSNTRMVACEHYLWTNGRAVDLRQVRDASRRVGAKMLVDATQSVGAVPYDISELAPDYFVASSYKWLLGPYGMSFCWFSPDARNDEGIEHHWLQRIGSDNFAGLVDYQTQLRSDSARFDHGGRSNFVSLAMAERAFEQLLSWKPANIAETLGALTNRICERAQEAGFGAMPSDERAPHILGLTSDRVNDSLLAQLKERNVFVSRRASSLRISPHVYNGEGDVETLFQALRPR